MIQFIAITNTMGIWVEEFSHYAKGHGHTARCSGSKTASGPMKAVNKRVRHTLTIILMSKWTNKSHTHHHVVVIDYTVSVYIST